MLIGFSALAGMLLLFTGPYEPIVWAGNTINSAIVAAAWVVADQLASRRNRSKITKFRCRIERRSHDHGPTAGNETVSVTTETDQLGNAS
jgi:hypothetical protein